MPNYGITNNLNVMASVPYVWTKASDGTLHGMKGFQDLSVFVKWRPLAKSFGKNQFSLFTIGGFSTPLSNYVIEFLPMSIGLGSTNVIARGMIDYRRGNFTATGSAAFIGRSRSNSCGCRRFRLRTTRGCGCTVVFDDRSAPRLWLSSLIRRLRQFRHLALQQLEYRPQGCYEAWRHWPFEAAFLRDRRPVKAVATLRRRCLSVDQVDEIGTYLQEIQGWDTGSKSDTAVVGGHPAQHIFVHNGAMKVGRASAADGGTSRISRHRFRCQ